VKRYPTSFQDADWHDRMSAAPDPNGFIAQRGAPTWEKLHDMCAGFVRDWERLPERDRRAYAFPNPEDRRMAR